MHFLVLRMPNSSKPPPCIDHLGNEFTLIVRQRVPISCRANNKREIHLVQLKKRRRDVFEKTKDRTASNCPRVKELGRVIFVTTCGEEYLARLKM